jgi:hypothetical protein
MPVECIAMRLEMGYARQGTHCDTADADNPLALRIQKLSLLADLKATRAVNACLYLQSICQMIKRDIKLEIGPLE